MSSQPAINKIAKSPLQISLLLLTVALSFLLQYPQPSFDIEYYNSLASDYNYNHNHNNNQQQHVGDTHNPLHGVTIVITGATSGIGRNTAVLLHGMGATIFAVGRSQRKLEELQLELDNSAAEDAAAVNTKGASSKLQQRRLFPILADQTDLHSVSAAAESILTATASSSNGGGGGGGIDILINNAGIGGSVFGDATTTKQGYDEVFGVNYLSHFLLTYKLLPLLRKSTRGGRVVQVTSGTHYMVDGSDLAVNGDVDDGATTTATTAPKASTKRTTIWHKAKAYPNSKLAQIYHARSLTDREQQHNHHHQKKKKKKQKYPPVRAISINPSWVATNITGEKGLTKRILQLFAFSPSGHGIAPILHASFHPAAGGDEEGIFDYVTGSDTGRLFWGHSYLPNGIRFVMYAMGAGVYLLVQRIQAKVEFVRSSDESYDVVGEGSVGDGLWDWSMGVIEPWI